MAKKSSKKSPPKKDVYIPPSKKRIDEMRNSNYAGVRAAGQEWAKDRERMAEWERGKNKRDANPNPQRRAENQTSGMRASARSFPRKGY